tara:strand:+ start:76 stop:417 length:342 start_codon:yes stop_codon:yes gene_type:complete
MEGTVKWFNSRKGYGFIVGEDGQEVFVHHTALKEGSFLRDGDKVSFEVAETEKGKQAKDVVLLQKGSEVEGGDSAEESAEEPAEETTEEPAEEEATEEPAEEASTEESTEEAA